MERKISHLANLLKSCLRNKTHLTSGRILHAHIIHFGLLSNTFLSNLLIHFYSNHGHTRTAYQLFTQIPERNIYSWNAILCALSKAGNLGDAHKLFVEMPERNLLSWNTLISTMVRSGNGREAFDAYNTMIIEGFLPNNFTLASILSACGVLLEVDNGKKVHGLVIKIGFERNIYVGNAMLSMYSNCGLHEYAFHVFEDMPEHNEVTFTTMIGGLVQIDQLREAFEMFRLMCRKGICIDSVSLSSILGVCAKGEFAEGGSTDLIDGLSPNVRGKQIHAVAVKVGLENDLHLSNSLLDMYAKIGDMDNAEKVFANLAEANVVSWNIMIAGYGNKQQTEKALEYLQKMQYCGNEPDDITYVNMLAACVRSGDIETACQIFDNLICPSLTSWNAILSGYIQIGNHREAIEIFRKMQFQYVRPDRTTLAVILTSCAEIGLLEDGKQVHAAAHKCRLHEDTYVASALISVYSRCGKIKWAKHAFNSISGLNIVCWNSFMFGLSLNSLDREAFALFKQMRKSGLFPSEFSYSTILSICAKVSSLNEGKQVHAHITKEGYVDDIYVASALVGMYCKCGNVDEARQFFDIMRNKNNAIWNEMIHGYAQHGLGYEALLLYKDMIRLGQKPDEITFVAVLTACSHSGLVDEGLEIFNLMQQEYGVEPILDHYTCIIDCLGRAGRLHEAEVILDNMPYKDNPVAWEVFLSSCRVHANVRLAKKAANELLYLDRQNSASYVLLANVYSSLGRWDDARTIRETMSDKQLLKDPGYSWNGYNNYRQSLLENNLALVGDQAAFSN